MHIFEYSADWAKLAVTSLAERSLKPDPQHPTYLCLCIGRKFDPVLADHYSQINAALGPALLVFSLFPPPHKFIVEHFKALRTLEDPRSDTARLAYKALLGKEHGDPTHEIVREKVQLLTGLAEAGLKDGQYADFLFFAIKPGASLAGLEVTAAAVKPLPEAAGPEAYVELFAAMAKKAEAHSKAGDSAEAFLKDLPLAWTAKIDILKAKDLLSYITSFVSIIREA